MFAPTILEFSDDDDDDDIYIPKKRMIFCDKFVSTKCSMLVISCTCDKVNSY
jgi:hypothetical protein